MRVLPHKGSVASFLFFTTVRIDTETPDKPCAGTGFFFTVKTSRRRGDGPDGTQSFVVTNRHVVEDATTIELSMLQGQDGRPVIGSDTGFVFPGSTDEGRNWFPHPNSDVDVAVIPLSALIWQLKKQGIEYPQMSTVFPDQVATPEQLSHVDPLESVAFVGYPDGLYDIKNLMPIARVGAIATLPELDYDGRRAFLIDAPAVPGSSGSPVFLHRPGPGNGLLLLGVLAEHRAAHTLGVVYKPWTINECIDDRLKHTGFRRAEGWP